MMRSVNGTCVTVDMVYDGIKSPSFAPSRVGKDEILYKTSLSRSYLLNVTENVLMAQFKYYRFEFAACHEAKVHQTVLLQHKAHVHSSSYK